MTPRESFPSTSAAETVLRANAESEGIESQATDLHAPVPRWKRALDIGIIILAAPLVMPLMLLIALMIRIVSPGPTFFRQSRIGHSGREFDLLKFRTMKPNADVSTHHNYLEQLMKSEAPMTKLDSRDPRLIPGGRLLRATGLDELPQLLNVLRGQMSLVGPRPCTRYEFDNYSPEQKRRFGSLPGLTGLWQVSGKNRTTFQEMIRLDVRYVETSNLILDLEILAKTPFAVLSQVSDTVLGPRRLFSGTGSANPEPVHPRSIRTVEG